MGYQFHEVSNIFPMMGAEEFRALKDDIAAHGLRELIWIYDGKIIDGRNRYNACIELGITPKFTEYEGDEESLLPFVLSLNLKRRHLTSSQKALIAVEVERYLAEEARKRQLASLRQYQELEPKDKDAFERRKEFLSSNRPLVKKLTNDSNSNKAAEQAAKIVGTNRQYVADAKKIIEKAPEIVSKVRDGIITIAEGKKLIPFAKDSEKVNRVFDLLEDGVVSNVSQALQTIARERVPEKAITPELPDNKYRCIVIDPPWPVRKIEREERPNQGQELDYPVMTLEEIEALPVSDLSDGTGCHLYLWVTHKYLPAGLQLVEKWGFKYQCLMTWVKPTGMTPYSWMYNTEHVIFATKGNIRLVRMGMKLSFEAPVTRHSTKPDIFYDRVVQASLEPRLEMFSRTVRDGFIAWGNEVVELA